MAEEKSYLDIPDEEFLNEKEPPVPEEQPNEDKEEVIPPPPGLEPEGEEPQSEQAGSDENVGEQAEEPGEEASEDTEQAEAEPEGSAEEPTAEGEAEAEPESQQVDEQVMQAFETLFGQPFKANGKEVKIPSPEDAIRLIQQGLNYNLKMRAIKPIRTLKKTLEQIGIVNGDDINEEELNFLIELRQGKPEAIKKLMKEKEIDPIDFDLDDQTAEQYRPENYIPDEKALILDEVIDEIKTSPVFEKTVDVLERQFDDQSRQYFMENPEALKYLTQDLETGVFDQIHSIIETERALGRLNGVSDIDAYIAIANSPQFTGSDEKAEGTTERKPNPAVVKKKKAAGPTSKAPAESKVPKDVNPLAMSDEEFEKLIGQGLD